MFSLHKKFQLSASVSVAFLLSFQTTCAQVPTIACPNYFRYFSDGTNYFGIILLPKISEGNTKLEVHLVQSGTIPERNPSNLSLYESEKVTLDNYSNGRPIKYRVDFPVRNVLPKLTLLSVNDNVVCSDQDYQPYSSKIKLIHNLTLKIKTLIIPFAAKEDNFEEPSPIPKPNYMGNPFLNNMSKMRPPVTPTVEVRKTNMNLEPKYTNNPFLSKLSTKPPSLIPPTESSNINSGSKSKYSSNPFLANLPKKNVSSTPDISELNEVCGRESLAVTPFIRGGTGLNRGEFPWLTAIYRKKGPDLKFICAGSLISARTVISAAHCFLEHKLHANRTLVLLGRNNLETIEENGSEHRSLQSLLLHPEYNSNAISDADIALLHLQTPVTFTRYIRPICLWNKAIEVNNIAGLKGYVAGWGADQNGELVTEQPKKIETHIADDNECKRSLENYQTMKSSRTICVSTTDNVGPCTGDSGGGLAMYADGHWSLRGIVSAGLTSHGKCISHDFYYFCDVAKHMNWIKQNMLI